MQPSGANKGFFQPAPILPNQFYDDVSFRRCFKRECETHVNKGNGPPHMPGNPPQVIPALQLDR